jgi:hypothetical protein
MVAFIGIRPSFTSSQTFSSTPAQISKPGFAAFSESA